MIGESGATGALVYQWHHCWRSRAQPMLRPSRSRVTLLRPSRSRATLLHTRAAAGLRPAGAAAPALTAINRGHRHMLVVGHQQLAVSAEPPACPRSAGWTVPTRPRRARHSSSVCCVRRSCSTPWICRSLRSRCRQRLLGQVQPASAVSRNVAGVIAGSRRRLARRRPKLIPGVFARAATPRGVVWAREDPVNVSGHRTSSPGEVQLLGDRDEVPQVAQLGCHGAILRDDQGTSAARRGCRGRFRGPRVRVSPGFELGRRVR